VRPIDLRLLAGQGAQTQIGFGLWPGAVARSDVAKVIGAAGITTFAHHGVEAGGGEPWELLQCLQDEGQVRIDAGRSAGCANARQPGLGQNPGDRIGMHAQLPGDGAYAPPLDMVVAQDLRLELGGNGHEPRPLRKKALRRNGEQGRPHQWQRQGDCSGDERGVCGVRVVGLLTVGAAHFGITSSKRC
jgi:hypothetical protein